MRCHSVGCGMASPTQSIVQSVTRSIAAAHMIPVIRVYDERGNVVETQNIRAISKLGDKPAESEDG
jgi:hypothetical protein